MNQLVKIIPIERYFSLSWIQHIRCNYDCMYCPDSRHNDYSEMPDFDTMCRHWIQIFEKTKQQQLPYKISFSGGEATINKHFVPFIKWLYENFSDRVHKLIITTNGSASTSYYLKLFEYLTNITFSIHTEYMPSDFLYKVKTVHDYAIKHNKFVHVLIMQEYWAVDQIKQIIEFCKDNHIPCNISKIVYQMSGSRQWPIFKVDGKIKDREDLKISQELIDNCDKDIDPLITLEDKYYNVDLQYQDGSSQRTFASKLRFMDMHHFQGWKCHAGVDRIFVLPDSAVYSGECENDFLGRLDNNSFQLLDQPQLCKRKNCTNNPDDLQTIKYAI